MIQKVEMYRAVCDGCGRIVESRISEKYILSIVKDFGGWREIDGKLYCPDCVEYDEETDSYKPKGKE